MTLRVDKRAVIDVRGLAERMGRETVARIRELADRGRGYKGSFAHLKDNTIERYERDGILMTTTKSILRRTGKLMDALRAVLKPVAEGVYTVNIFGPIGYNRETGSQNSRRPFLGLSPSDFKRIAAGGARDVKVKSERP